MAVRTNGGVAHFEGLQTCGSIHACPVCSPKIRASRADEIEAAVTQHLADGGGAQFLTLTLPHDEGDRLQPLLDAVLSSWRRAQRSRGWDAERVQYGVIGRIRAFEVTHGVNGWHPHLHILLFTKRPLAAIERQAWCASIGARWSLAVQSHGYRPPAERYGATMSAVTTSAAVSRYTSKVYDEAAERSWHVGNELARHDLKAARRGGRNAFAIACDAQETGDAGDVRLWREYERATRGRQAIAWSNGLRARFGVVHKSDEQLAEEQVGGEVVTMLDGDAWRVVSRRRGGRTAVLDAAELGGERAVWDLVLRWSQAGDHRLTG